MMDATMMEFFIINEIIRKKKQCCSDNEMEDINRVC